MLFSHIARNTPVEPYPTIISLVTGNDEILRTIPAFPAIARGHCGGYAMSPSLTPRTNPAFS